MIVKAQLWDTAGQEKYRAITVAHYRKALGALIVYDLTKRSSFDNLRFWLGSLQEHSDPKQLHIMLVGNKLDKVEMNPSDRQVTMHEVKMLASEFPDLHDNIMFFETSAVLENA